MDIVAWGFVAVIVLAVIALAVIESHKASHKAERRRPSVKRREAEEERREKAKRALEDQKASSHLAWLGIFAILLFIVGWACGPTFLCYAQGGEAVSNAYGAKWCELDGNGFPSDGDQALMW